jgi:hypothetical protein
LTDTGKGDSEQEVCVWRGSGIVVVPPAPCGEPWWSLPTQLAATVLFALQVDDPRIAMLRLLTSAKAMVLLIVLGCVPLVLVRSVLFVYRPLLNQTIHGKRNFARRACTFCCYC